MVDYVDQFILGNNGCGKNSRKYLYVLGVFSVLILLITYIYEYRYLPAKARQAAQGVAVNSLTAAPVAANGAMAQGVAARLPPMIPANATPPANHQQDGRAQMACTTCHQVQGGGMVNGQVVNQDRPVLGMGMPQQILAPPPLPLAPQMLPQPAAQAALAQVVPQPLPEDGVGRVPFADVVREVRPSVVNINSVRTATPAQPVINDGKPRFADPFSGTSVESVGSGVIVSHNGYIVTNYHVIKNSSSISVTVFADTGSVRYSGEITKVDEQQDLALVKIAPDTLLKPALLGDSSKLEVAESVVTVGSPYGLDQTVSRGIIAGLRKTMVIENVNHDQLIQTDAAINQGNSGGALINRSGEVIGINTAIYTPTGAFSGIGFAIPINKVKLFIMDKVPLTTGQAQAVGSLPVVWPMAGNPPIAQGVAAVVAPPIRANATPPGSHSDGRSQMQCSTCHKMVMGGGAATGNPVAWGQGGAPMGQNVAPPQGPPIAADAPIPGNHRRDGRDKVACNVCHKITGGAAQGAPVVWNGSAVGQNVAVQQGPPIRANDPIPANHRRDGRDQIACNQCHQILGGTPALAPQGNGVAFIQPQPPISSGNSTYPVPMVVATNPVAVQTQRYFDGAILEPLTAVVVQRTNAQVTDGAFVSTVYPDTAAARAGLMAGDIIFKINGRWVLNPDDLLQAVAAYQVGDNLRLGVYTGGQRRNLYLVFSGQNQQPLTGMGGGQNPPTTPVPVGMMNELLWLGMELKPITDALVAKDPLLVGKQGSLVSDVDKGSVAEANGILKGDLLKRINGIPVNNINELQQMVNSADPNQGILLLLERNGRSIYLTLK